MENFSVGRAISRTFELVGKGFRGAGLFLLIVYAAYTLVSFFTQRLMLDQMTQAMDPADPSAALGIFTSPVYWLSLLLSLVLVALMYSGSIHGYLRAARGSEVSPGECFSVGLAKVLPMLALTLLWGIAIFFGFMLIIVPGVILITLWVAIMPALVGEGCGIIESFGRSRELTRGSRWSVFAVLLIFVIALYVLMILILGSIIGATAMGGGFNPEAMANMTNPLVLVVSGLFGWIMAMMLSAMLTSVYVELMLVKEGGLTGQLNEVFE
jgi:hypothetical protein